MVNERFYLFYSYHDFIQTKRLIMSRKSSIFCLLSIEYFLSVKQSANATRGEKAVRLENLHRVYAYYLNDVDFR